MIGNRMKAGSCAWSLLTGALVFLSLSQMPASAQGESARGNILISSDGERSAIKAAAGRESKAFEGSGRELRFHETDDALANYSSRESASEFMRLLKARPRTAPRGVESIIGTDDRTRVTPTTRYPARATVLIFFQDSGGSNFLCSGWLIGKDTVATAGHCLADGGSGVFFPRGTYRIFPGRNGSRAPYGSCGARTLYTNTIWLNNGFDDYDYGAIKLNCKIGKTTGWYGFFWQSTSLIGLPVKTQGYPGDKALTQWRSWDQVRDEDVRRVFYQADTVGGQSGSPVWYNRPGCGVCGMAIHAYGTGGSPPFSTNNHGTRITQEVFNFLQFVKSQ